MRARITEDPELVAIHAILAALGELDRGQRTRVLDYVISRAESLGLDPPRRPSGNGAEEVGELAHLDFPDPPEVWSVSVPTTTPVPTPAA